MLPGKAVCCDRRRSRGLSDGLAPLDGLGEEAYCFFNVEDRVDRVLKERGEFEETQGGGGQVVALRDREAPTPSARTTNW